MIPKVTLNNGATVPMLGLGTSQMKNPADTVGVIKTAIGLGYRLIDTATMYGNEEAVGQGIRESGVPRKEIVVTTKLWPDDFADPEAALALSLSKLGLDYVDIYLVHWPQGMKPSVWKALERFVQDGRAKTIGVSNFSIQQTDDVLSYCTIPPAINQIEFNPFKYDRELVEYSKSKNIVIEAYKPLTRGAALDDTTVAALAKKYGKTSAQIFIRWGIEHGAMTIPKSTHEERLKENMDVFDFKLSAEDVGVLDALS
ncbi:MAG TPA: aldo/keto reductase [Candidatus Paceibacterota bacterium]|nr:aldo/keto reductase [Candidatus Paceibacterota bacterium]